MLSHQVQLLHVLLLRSLLLPLLLSGVRGEENRRSGEAGGWWGWWHCRRHFIVMPEIPFRVKVTIKQLGAILQEFLTFIEEVIIFNGEGIVGLINELKMYQHFLIIDKPFKSFIEPNAWL